jgi:hypothetical protein
MPVAQMKTTCKVLRVYLTSTTAKDELNSNIRMDHNWRIFFPHSYVYLLTIYLEDFTNNYYIAGPLQRGPNSGDFRVCGRRRDIGGVLHVLVPPSAAGSGQLDRLLAQVWFQPVH